MKIKQILIKIIAIIFILQLIVLPTTSNAGIWDDVFSQGKSFLDGSESSVDQTELAESLSTIFKVLSGIGVVLSVIIGGILGIKFMTASAEDKAKVKESMIPYVLGCLVIFGAFAIWRLIIQVLQSM